MIARIEPDRTGASVVSIPRDSWVEIPGRGFNKINAAYSFGGPSLLIQTVEDLTALRIDHFAVIDFAGFQSMVDSVGGIDVAIAEATRNQGVDFRQGVNHLHGAQALAYVQQRYGLPNGDLDRAHRQQNALRALLAKAASSGTLSDPIALYDLLDATSRSVGVDDTLSNGGLRSLALDLRGLRPSAVTFLNAPVAGLGREGAQSVVVPRRLPLDGSVDGAARGQGRRVRRPLSGGCTRSHHAMTGPCTARMIPSSSLPLSAGALRHLVPRGKKPSSHHAWSTMFVVGHMSEQHPTGVDE